MLLQVLHYVEKPETYVSNIINAGAYLFSTEVFKHMAQAFDEHHKNELVVYVCVCVCVCLYMYYLYVCCVCVYVSMPHIFLSNHTCTNTEKELLRLLSDQAPYQTVITFKFSNFALACIQ